MADLFGSAVVKKYDAAPGEFVSRDLFFKTFTIGAGTIAQADLNALVEAVHATSSIEVIGTVTLDTSTTINMVISGADVSNVADAVLTGFTASDVAGW